MNKSVQNDLLTIKNEAKDLKLFHLSDELKSFEDL